MGSPFANLILISTSSSDMKHEPLRSVPYYRRTTGDFGGIQTIRRKPGSDRLRQVLEDHLQHVERYGLWVKIGSLDNK